MSTYELRIYILINIVFNIPCFLAKDTALSSDRAAQATTLHDSTVCKAFTKSFDTFPQPTIPQRIFKNYIMEAILMG